MMRAAFLTGPRSLAIRDVQLAAPESGQLLVRVAACGVCGSNLHDWNRGSAAGPLRRQVPGASGHEISAVVVEAGTAVSSFEVGDHVVIDPSAAGACSRCPACLDGAAWFCESKSSLAAYGFAEEMVIPAAAAFRIPTGLDLRVAALAEPIACGVHAIRHSWTAAGSGRVDERTVVVLGAGMLGLGAAMAARYLGAGDLTIVARHVHQAELAAAVRPDRVVPAHDPDLVQTLRKLRPDLVVEAVGGGAETFDLATKIVAWRGEISVLGAFDTPQSVDLAHALAREHRHFFPVSYAMRNGVHDIDVALAMMASDQFPVDRFATHFLSLEQVGEAFCIASDKRTGAIRVLVGSTGS